MAFDNRTDRQPGSASKARRGRARAGVLARRRLPLLLHLADNGRYDVFRDELYFIVCGQHPALGYVDQPPLIPLIAAASHALFGASAWPLRLVPALAMAATTALDRRICAAPRRRPLRAMAVRPRRALCAGAARRRPVADDRLSAAADLACLRLVPDPRRANAGRALVARLRPRRRDQPGGKYLILFFLASLAVGVLATPLRRSLARPWIYRAPLIALAVPRAPASIGRRKTAGRSSSSAARRRRKNSRCRRWPSSASRRCSWCRPRRAIWLAGLWRFSVRPPLPALRAFPIAFVVMQVLVYLLHGKAYYLAPIYPILFAGGALCDRGLARAARSAPLASP